ncbi:hypothetical protein AJ79_07221 [Helicocarpus griseus UAMH5409]|uniref:Aminoglycoside phosphotransferase domain-containing protein n=1 Tax=Helicocarpus griseus UAMH5409 TaxID=1447875 RepID=A0A2B7X5N8_9EURO|nr:hypothetical protein AJ79_07221 [Helicocarpus griseus UAMH5409]
MDVILSFILKYTHPLTQRSIVQICPQTWLISICQRAQTQKDFYITQGVLRLSTHLGVQRGCGIRPSRPAMQDYAYKRLDPAVVRVPRVYRFFIDHLTERPLPDGYLFMDYIPGKTLEKLDATATENNCASKALMERIANIVVHLQGIKAEAVSTSPGPVDGGMPHGYLWGDYGAKRVFHSVSDMNSWLNERLEVIGRSIDLSPCYPLVLCHGDLVRRNIIVMEDDDGDEEGKGAGGFDGRRIALVDWGHAALLPRVFEIAAMSCYNDRTNYAYARELEEVTREAIGD